MKFIHLSDLHLGKRVNEFSMIQDQRYMLEQILSIIRAEQPQGVLIAGDVYDKAVPTAEAVGLLDEFLVRLAQERLQVFLISGNHDSPERLAFGGRLMEHSGIHISPVYDGHTAVYTLEDAYGPVRVYLLPFVKPAHVRRYFPQREIDSYTDGVRTAIEAMGVDEDVRNVLVTHQFVTGATRCDSEECSVGGSDNVDVSVFDSFDYVALGHLHGPQSVGRAEVRYCGTPLKYSFSEAKHEKSVTVVEMEAKGTIHIRTVPLTPMRDLVELRGSYDQLSLREFYQKGGYQQDYVHITLTDEEDIPDGLGKLRIIYPYLMKLDYDNQRTRSQQQVEGTENVERKSPLELLEEFYQVQNGQPMGEQQREFARGLVESIWEDER
ncbi:exonuclease SbcCD subunit D [Pseudoflavonifractor capillosus]|uniref:exonuclease SbcCD subunit D n=1 Tax=Pseudoflavonifractor capillosus TaxID=106588 RepID=UPI00195BAD2A|nr:exonuclease SbcCD subunit D [Pseudoflavonifractor capillosus]MBM6895928.1 exonuclease SbcCD subunit D [Pseudoflavonifractor capillosus]